MDVTARIEEVIATKGLTKSKVAERMGKFNQAFNRLITNPKWETIELVAQAIGISTEELLFGDNITRELNEVPKSNFWNNEQQIDVQTFGVIICPYCRKGIQLCLTKDK